MVENKQNKIIPFPENEWFNGRWSLENDIVKREVLIQNVSLPSVSIEFFHFYDAEDIIDQPDEKLEVNKIKIFHHELFFETKFPSVGRVLQYKLKLTKNLNLLKGKISYKINSPFSIVQKYKEGRNIVNVYVISDDDFWSEYHIYRDNKGKIFVKAYDTATEELYKISFLRLIDDNLIFKSFIKSENKINYFIFNLSNNNVKFKVVEKFKMKRIC